jgi:hypothetical protein
MSHQHQRTFGKKPADTELPAADFDQSADKFASAASRTPTTTSSTAPGSRPSSATATAAASSKHGPQRGCHAAQTSQIKLTHTAILMWSLNDDTTCSAVSVETVLTVHAFSTPFLPPSTQSRQRCTSAHLVLWTT